MNSDTTPIIDLPERLRVQANNVEAEGHITAARLMREAAAEIEHWRDKVSQTSAGAIPARQTEIQMTMHPQTTSTLTASEWRANQHRMTEALAALAAKWGVEAVGRQYPRHVVRSGGYRFVRAGKWYVVRAGERIPATAAQSRDLNAAGSAITTYGSIGPVAAA